eukprot:CAMPEP_0114555642 /NCGR_PEP_ID=MMETSP0114-20121206/8861_1 /TAXON_ID=31324 /ORGANISM="Goniomonas sp, Strain m" /LENGTH=99 /DNA_ID=CAMNT_0001740787 /DNA_START=250 /DNA_END=546 /DNA_ORIENTATION=-
MQAPDTEGVPHRPCPCTRHGHDAGQACRLLTLMECRTALLPPAPDVTMPSSEERRPMGEEEGMADARRETAEGDRGEGRPGLMAEERRLAEEATEATEE